MKKLKAALAFEDSGMPKIGSRVTLNGQKFIVGAILENGGVMLLPVDDEKERNALQRKGASGSKEPF